MNTPNKLTVLRLILVPVFIIFYLVDVIPYHYILSFLVFVIASLTDLLDGHLARKNNQVTTFGKFLDPLADKVLVISALVCFIENSYVSSVVVIIIIAREFLVTSLRLIALSHDGAVIAADNLGKIKTIIQMTSIITILLLLSVASVISLPAFINIELISNILMWITALITVISGMSYLIKNISYVNTTK